MRYIVNIGWESFQFVDADLALDFAKTAKTFMVVCPDHKSTVTITIEDDEKEDDEKEDE